MYPGLAVVGELGSDGTNVYFLFLIALHLPLDIWLSPMCTDLGILCLEHSSCFPGLLQGSWYPCGSGCYTPPVEPSDFVVFRGVCMLEN